MLLRGVSMDSTSSLLHLSALGIYFHAVFVSLTLGLPLVIMSLLYKYSRTSEEKYLNAVRVATMVLAVNFALGAITGTLVEFGLVQIWPGTNLAIATFAFAPLALELIAFANEIAFLILFIVTLGRVKTMYSILILALYWVFALFSGLLITTVNSWLVAPWGIGSVASALYPFMPSYGPLVTDPQKLVALKIILLASGQPLQAVLQLPDVAKSIGIILTDPLVSLVSPYAVISVLHNLIAAVIIGSSLPLAAWAYRYYRSGNNDYVKILRAFFIPLLVLILIQPTLIGHFMGEAVVKYNPTKFAMMEGAKETFYNPIVALVAYGDPNHPIIGFDRLAQKCDSLGNQTIGDLAKTLNLSKDTLISIANSINVKLDPNKLDTILSTKVRDVCISDLNKALQRLELVHIAYYTKIGGGVVAFVASIALAGLLYNVPVITPLVNLVLRPIKRNETKIFLLASLIFIGVVLAAFFGWFVREVGRKPWTVYGLLYPEELVSISPVSREPSFVATAALIILGVNLGGLYAMYVVATRELRFLDLLKKGLGAVR
jgi:cytochrome d ubiquinol oxidase subunit I